MEEKIDKAIGIIRQGGIVIFPTDTAFGIGCRIDNEESVKKLFAIRNRPETQAAPVLVSSIEMAKEYLQEFPKEVEELMNKHWPGALTIVFPCKTEKVPSLVRGGGETLGVRLPNHPIPQELIKGVGVPILGPSANFHGKKTPYRFEELNQELVRKVDLVLEGECMAGNISTVIDGSTQPFKIIRQGAVIIDT